MMSLYVGLGMYSWQQLRFDDAPEQTQTLFRNVTTRADLYGSYSLNDELTLSLSAPIVYSRVLDSCEDSLFPCDPILTVGTASLSARYQLEHVGAGLVLQSSSWNAPTRGHYNTVGEATTDIGPALYLRDRYGAFSWTAWGQYLMRTTFYRASGGAPHDDVRAGLELSQELRPVTLTASAFTYQRLGGIEVASLLGSDDRWALADYDNVSAQAKLGLALRDDFGLHLSASRVLWVRNGPPDAFDVSLGFSTRTRAPDR